LEKKFMKTGKEYLGPHNFEFFFNFQRRIYSVFFMGGACGHADFICALRIMAFLFGEEVLRIMLK